MNIVFRSIVIHTNEEANRVGDSFQVSFEDILCFIAVLYCRGVFCQKVSQKELWNTKYGIPIISMLLSRDKFSKIMKYLRFDSKRYLNVLI